MHPQLAWRGWALLAVLASSIACQGASGQEVARADLLKAASSWGYQLQKVDPAALAGLTHDVFVIDYSRDGGDDGALSRADIARLQQKPDGTRRIVLAYMSIGEAEDYRFYWKWHWGYLWGLFAPSWRRGHNSAWQGNYAVRYWEADWQQIILGPDVSYMDRILKAGFDGVWLDKIDSSLERVAKGRPRAREDMMAFVKRIGEQGRAASPGFLVVPQNGDELLTDAAYRATIDAIGKEDLLFGEERDKAPNTAEIVEQRMSRLKLLTVEGKPVFAVEYLDKPDDIAVARQQLEAAGFVPHFAVRALDRMSP